MPLKLNSSGGGSVTLDVPATATATSLIIPSNAGTVVTTGSTGVVTQAMLASGVVGNGPAFSAYLGSNQSVSTAVTTKLAFNTELFDTNNNFDTTNHRFLPTVAGYYQINSTIYMSDMGTPEVGIINSSLYKNGSTFAFGTYRLVGNFAEIDTASWLVYMNGSTDYLEMYFVQTTGGTRTMASGTAGNLFTGALVRAA